MFWPLFLPFWVVFTHLQKHQGLCWGLLIPESRFKDSPGTFDPVTCQDSLFVPFTPWLQSTCVNLTRILLFPTPTRHNHPRIYLRSLSPVQGSRNTLDLKAWVGLPATAALLCPLTCPSLLRWPLLATPSLLALCPLLLQSSCLSTSSLPAAVSSKSLLCRFLPRDMGSVCNWTQGPWETGQPLTPTCFLLAPHPENALTRSRWMLQRPATGVFSSSHLLPFRPEPVYPGEFCFP